MSHRITRRELAISGITAPGFFPSDRHKEVDSWLMRLGAAPTEFTLIPFWFWNDDLNEAELIRQIADFEAHGVHGFVIHPRIGLPERIGFMSDQYLHYCRVAVDEAARRKMIVHLYDEGMYPSGSACGKVVAENPKLASRCLLQRTIPAGADPQSVLQPGETLVWVHEVGMKRTALVDARSLGKIRGVHFGQDDGQPGAPPASDLLNPETARAFIRHVHDRYYSALKPHFGKTVRAIFTDEPSFLGKGPRAGAKPWTTGIERLLAERLDEDIRPKLIQLWDRGEASQPFRDQIARVLNERLEETYYRPLSQWCSKHGIALTGHPSGPGDIGVLKHFQLPGQDIVWRYIEPGKPTAVEGDQSVTGKCSSSAKVHLGAYRNGNECFGAYGWNFTYREMIWLSRWFMVRGVDLLWPHAFYYSIRGPRRDERPPDVGPNNTWWPTYQQYADEMRRTCWLNAIGKQQVSIAILGRSDSLPWRAAKVCFENQFDFNYLEARHLLDGSAKVGRDGIRIRGMHYRCLIIDGETNLEPALAAALESMQKAGRLIHFPLAATTGEPSAQLPGRLISLGCAPQLKISPNAPGLRVRELQFPEVRVWYLFNEGETPIEAAVQTSGITRGRLLDAETLQTITELDSGSLPLRIPPHGAQLLVATRKK